MLALRQKAETDDDDIRQATPSLGTAFTVLRSSWPGFKDRGIKGQGRGHLGTLLLDYHEEHFLVQRGHVVHHIGRSPREAGGP